MEPRNRFQGINSASLCSLAGRYDNPIPPRCLAPIDSLKIPAQFEIARIKCYMILDLCIAVAVVYWYFPYYQGAEYINQLKSERESLSADIASLRSLK
jgi:hypothetical protein